jgi:orotate phosphoribosyltransferase-like protein
VESQFLETEDFSAYQGKWVAILDKKIIATGNTIAEAYENALKSSPTRTPLFQRIPNKGETDTFIL